MACSSGSNGVGRQASRAVVSSRCSAGVAVGARQSTSSPSTTARTTCMRLVVSVPVLSVHRTVAAPSVSIARSRRTTTLARAMRQAPSARQSAIRVGSPCGSAASISASPASAPCCQSAARPPRVRATRIISSAPAAPPTMATLRTKRPVACCRPFGMTGTASAVRRLVASAVRAPVATTSAIAVAGGDQGAGIHRTGSRVARSVEVAQRRRSHLAGRNRGAGQQGFIDAQPFRLAQQSIRRHPIAGAEHDQIAAHQGVGRDAFRSAIADGERGRLRALAQGCHGVRGAPLPQHRQQEDGGEADRQDDGIDHGAGGEVQPGGGGQQQEHRLAHHPTGDGGHAMPIAGGQCIEPIGGQAVAGERAVEAALAVGRAGVPGDIGVGQQHAAGQAAVVRGAGRRHAQRR